MQTIDAYVTQLASADPTPGGGSAACLVGALGSALCAMVARISLGAARLDAVHAEAAGLAEAADRLRARFLAAQAQDEQAYAAVVAASALPKGDGGATERRTTALQAALTGAADAPLRAAGLCVEGFALALRAAELGNRHLASDVECAVHFFRAALEASIANVRINHHFMHDRAVIDEQDARLTAIRASAAADEKRALADSR